MNLGKRLIALCSSVPSFTIIIPITWVVLKIKFKFTFEDKDLLHRRTSQRTCHSSAEQQRGLSASGHSLIDRLLHVGKASVWAAPGLRPPPRRRKQALRRVSAGWDHTVLHTTSQTVPLAPSPRCHGQ